MSICRIIASDIPLAEFKPSQDYPLEINLDKGTMYDGGADDNYFITNFTNIQDYSKKKYGVSLEWNYTDGRAKQIIEYMRSALLKTDSVEFQLVWLMDYYEFEDRPFIHKKTIRIDELNIDHIKEIDSADIWANPELNYREHKATEILIKALAENGFEIEKDIIERDFRAHKRNFIYVNDYMALGRASSTILSSFLTGGRSSIFRSFTS